ncbi:hypothetical protein BJ138DRAFT_1114766 [Hygrophoropsis aurantiaca]|uniref:Uncharacterized protein n=1 Tax=Hygrophoropsis aurantiaca TaxID=72124 RepID=A0ACB8A993_9AGAM|nr:hypothetical protein BJ138DRAFT_1114766 [Hygrophoropsis aurantiaca]
MATNRFPPPIVAHPGFNIFASTSGSASVPADHGTRPLNHAQAQNSVPKNVFAIFTQPDARRRQRNDDGDMHLARTADKDPFAVFRPAPASVSTNPAKPDVVTGAPQPRIMAPTIVPIQNAGAQLVNDAVLGVQTSARAQNQPTNPAQNYIVPGNVNVPLPSAANDLTSIGRSFDPNNAQSAFFRPIPIPGPSNPVPAESVNQAPPPRLLARPKPLARRSLIRTSPQEPLTQDDLSRFEADMREFELEGKFVLEPLGGIRYVTRGGIQDGLVGDRVDEDAAIASTKAGGSGNGEEERRRREEEALRQARKAEEARQDKLVEEVGRRAWAKIMSTGDQRLVSAAKQAMEEGEMKRKMRAERDMRMADGDLSDTDTDFSVRREMGGEMEAEMESRDMDVESEENDSTSDEDDEDWVMGSSDSDSSSTSCSSLSSSSAKSSSSGTSSPPSRANKAPSNNHNRLTINAPLIPHSNQGLRLAPRGLLVPSTQYDQTITHMRVERELAGTRRWNPYARKTDMEGGLWRSKQ